MIPFVQSEIDKFYVRIQLREPAVKNPFQHRLNLPWTKKIEILLCFVFVFPLRLPLALFIFSLVIFISNVMIFDRDPNDFRTPLSYWRRKVKIILRILARSLFFVMGFHKVRVKGKLANSHEAPICVYAPHSSFLDALILSVVDTVPCSLSKIENFQSPFIAAKLAFFMYDGAYKWEELQSRDSLPSKIPGLKSGPVFCDTSVCGAAFMAIESIGVRRDCTKSRLQSVEEVKYRTITTRGQWPHLAIWPEGTCTNRRALISFKPGAFIPGCPVQPCCVKFPGIPDVYSWVYDGPSGFQLFMLIMCMLNHEAEVEFLPVCTPSTEETENPKLFAEHVKERMARCLGLPSTGHSFEDCLLMREASKLDLPDDAGIVEFRSVSSELGMNLDYMKARLKTFAAIDSNKDGVITLHDYARHYRLPICTVLKQLFAAFDPDNSGQVTFRQYLIGTACLSGIGTRKPLAHDALRFLQKYSKPDGKLASVVDQQIVDGMLRCVDQMFCDDYNVRSRNEELCEFISCNPEFVVLLSLLLSRDDKT